MPGQLLGASGLFVLLGVLAEYPPATSAATLAAWGFDLAAILNILPAGISGGSNPRPAPGQVGRTTKPGGPKTQPGG